MMRSIRHQALLGVCALQFATASLSWAQQNTAAAAVFGGDFSALLPEQKALVEDWFQRFGQVNQTKVDPQEGYNQLPLSVRTTFSAVTHALLRTALTDSSGTPLGATALSLIDKIDTVAGQVRGAGGDRQFRLYVQLKPGTQAILADSRQFGRKADNTVFHKGFPICFRSTTGVPSIQFSLARDGERADIDVDYRSSQFPVFLVNGHLSSSNSDVRAGNNDARHNQQWAGLQNWWRSLLGLPLLETQPSLVAGEVVTPLSPDGKPGAPPAEAVQDFLHSWLVDQRPDRAEGYIGESAIACMELENRQSVDRGMARFALLRDMQAVNRRVGKVADLNDASLGVRLFDPRLKLVEQSMHSAFEVYQVREDLAQQFLCSNQLDSSQMNRKAARSKKFGKYIAAVFRLKAGDRLGDTVATLWAKESNYWKLISYDLEPEFERYRVPSTAAKAGEEPRLPVVTGDQALIRSAESMLKTWLVQRNASAALQHVSDRASSCVALYAPDDAPAATRSLLQQGMDSFAQSAGATKKLDSAIAAPEFHHPDLKLVKHSQSKAFAIVALPDIMADDADCSQRKRGEDLAFRADGDRTISGKSYAVGFTLKNAPENPAVLWTVWRMEAGAWKVVSYALLTP